MRAMELNGAKQQASELRHRKEVATLENLDARACFDTAELRMDRVRALRAAIESHTYRVNAADLAESLRRHLRRI